MALDNEVAMYQNRDDFQNKMIYRQYCGLTTTTHHGLDLNSHLQTLKVHFTSQRNRVSLNPQGERAGGLLYGLYRYVPIYILGLKRRREYIFGLKQGLFFSLIWFGIYRTV